MGCHGEGRTPPEILASNLCAPTRPAAPESKLTMAPPRQRDRSTILDACSHTKVPTMHLGRQQFPENRPPIPTPPDTRDACMRERMHSPPCGPKSRDGRHHAQTVGTADRMPFTKPGRESPTPPSRSWALVSEPPARQMHAADHRPRPRMHSESTPRAFRERFGSTPGALRSQSQSCLRNRCSSAARTRPERAPGDAQCTGSAKRNGARPAKHHSAVPANPEALEKRERPAGSTSGALMKPAMTYFPAGQYHRRQGLNCCVRDGNRCFPLSILTGKSAGALPGAGSVVREVMVFDTAHIVR